MSAIKLSELQYPMLEVFYKAGADYYMTIEEAQAYDQRPFRSMLIQKWVAFRPGRGFHITRDGAAAWRQYHERSIMRLNPSLPLTAYFDATAYGLKKPSKKASVHVMPRRMSA